MTLAAAVRVKAVLPLAVRVAGEKAAVTPVGKPVTANATEELRPAAVAEIVSDPVLLTGMVKEVALEVIVSAGTTTTRDSVAVCFREPLVPVIVSVEVLAGALDATASFSALAAAPLMLAGVKVAVTPVGSPLTDRATAALKPFCGGAVTLKDAEAPSMIDKEVEAAERVNVGTTTTSETFTVALSEPLVPVIVSVEVPAAAPDATVSFSALAVVPLMLVGVKVAVTPLGSPATDRATAELKPFCGGAVTLKDAEAPVTIDKDVEAAERVNVGIATTSETLTVALSEPLMPVMTTGYVPAATVAEVTSLSALVVVDVMEVGVIVAVTPVGRPETARDTAELKPF